MRIANDPQLNLFRHSDAAMAAAYRAAAETARNDPHYPPDVAEQRAAYYLAEAEKFTTRSQP